MDSGVLAARRLRAWRRIVVSAEALGQHLELDVQVAALKSAHAPNKEIKQLKQSEGIADLLEAIAKATGASTAEVNTPAEMPPVADDSSNMELVPPADSRFTETIGVPDAKVGASTDAVTAAAPAPANTKRASAHKAATKPVPKKR